MRSIIVHASLYLSLKKKKSELSPAVFVVTWGESSMQVSMVWSLACIMHCRHRVFLCVTNSWRHGEIKGLGRRIGLRSRGCCLGMDAHTGNPYYGKLQYRAMRWVLEGAVDLNDTIVRFICSIKGRLGCDIDHDISCRTRRCSCVAGWLAGQFDDACKRLCYKFQEQIGLRCFGYLFISVRWRKRTADSDLDQSDKIKQLLIFFLYIYMKLHSILIDTVCSV